MIWLVGCAGFFEIGSERGFRGADTGDVTFEGYVYESPDVGDETTLDSGYLGFTPDGGSLVLGEQLYESYPAYWTVTLPPSTDFTLRMEAPDAWPTLWRGRSPETSGIWYNGALFAADTAFMESWIAELDLPIMTDVADLGDGAVAHLWGSPGEDGWECADVRVNGEPALCFLSNEDGSISRVTEGDFTWFMAFNLEPGAVTVESGLGASSTYDVPGGVWIFAFYFQGAP